MFSQNVVLKSGLLIPLFGLYRRDMTICQDSNTSEWIYVIKAGQCKIVKAVRLCPRKLGSVRYRNQTKARSGAQSREANNCTVKSSVSVFDETARSN